MADTDVQKQLKELHGEMQKTWHDLKAEFDKEAKAIAEQKTVNAELAQKMGNMEATLSDLEGKQKELLEKLNRVPNPDEKTADQKKAEAKELLTGWMRKGNSFLNNLEPEKKQMLISDDTTGGYLAVPPDVISEVIKDVVEFSPIRSLARVRTTSSRSVKQPKRTGTISASWGGGEAKTNKYGANQKITYGMEEVPNHELVARVAISLEDLEDTAVDLVQVLNEEASEQFGVAEGTAFVTGDADKKPEGILTNGTIPIINSGNASDLTADGIFDLYFGVKTFYTQRASWLLNRSTINRIRKFKHSGDGTYIWSPGLNEATPPSILGRPIVEAVDMPDIAADAFPIVFGDIQRLYMIVDRLALAVQRDDFTESDNGLVIFRLRRRVGGQVMQAEAAAIQKVAA